MYLSIPAATLYRWFSGLYLEELSEERLKHYQSNEGRAFLNELSLEASLRPVINKIMDLVETDPIDRGLVLDLAGEYARLFLGTHPHLSAPPYASAYLSPTGLLYQESTGVMNRLLSELDLNTAPDIREPADHLAIQLNVLATLLDHLETAKVEQNLKQQDHLRNQLKMLMDEQLLSWLPLFCQDCKKAGEDSFYGLLGESLLTRLKQDQQHLDL